MAPLLTRIEDMEVTMQTNTQNVGNELRALREDVQQLMAMFGKQGVSQAPQSHSSCPQPLTHPESDYELGEFGQIEGGQDYELGEFGRVDGLPPRSEEQSPVHRAQPSCKLRPDSAKTPRPATQYMYAASSKITAAGRGEGCTAGRQPAQTTDANGTADAQCVRSPCERQCVQQRMGCASTASHSSGPTNSDAMALPDKAEECPVLADRPAALSVEAASEAPTTNGNASGSATRRRRAPRERTCAETPDAACAASDWLSMAMRDDDGCLSAATGPPQLASTMPTNGDLHPRSGGVAPSATLAPVQSGSQRGSALSSPALVRSRAAMAAKRASTSANEAVQMGSPLAEADDRLKRSWEEC